MHTYLAQLWKLLNLPKGLQLFIMRLFNDEFLVGVTGVIINDRHEVLLVKHTYRQTPWSLPGGYLKRGEHPREGMEREILEETGLRVRVEKLIKTAHDPVTARLDITCYGKFIEGTFTKSAEVSECGFFSINSLPEIGDKQTKVIHRVFKQENIQRKNVFGRIVSMFRRK